MYPFLRLAAARIAHRNAPRIGFFDVLETRHMCWPHDLDPWLELNNGRTLTLYDLGRIALSHRIRLVEALRPQGWGMTVAGSSVRYRRRVRAFDQLRVLSFCHGWDARFLYFDQSMWRGAECCSQLLMRIAIVGPEGIVAPERAAPHLGIDPQSPLLPEWVQAWSMAESARPWPPRWPSPPRQ